MAIDMKAMRAKLNALKNGGGKNNFWRPQDGDQDVRIVAPEDGDPFKDYYFHYNVGNASGFLCPKKNYGDDCPVWRDGGGTAPRRPERTRPYPTSDARSLW